jgi:hypothetical protein
MGNNDFTMDIFLIYEELKALDGNAPPMARKDLGEFLHFKRQPFVKCYHHVIAVNPTAQAYLAPTCTTLFMEVICCQPSNQFFEQSRILGSATCTMAPWSALT